MFKIYYILLYNDILMMLLFIDRNDSLFEEYKQRTRSILAKEGQIKGFGLNSVVAVSETATKKSL